MSQDLDPDIRIAIKMRVIQRTILLSKITGHGRAIQELRKKLRRVEDELSDLASLPAKQQEQGGNRYG